MECISITYKSEKRIIKVNDKFNRLKILDIYKIDNNYYAKCECSCGVIIEKILIRSLLSENTKSCGCLNKELRYSRNFKHGDSFRNNRSRLYCIWQDMKRRCYSQDRKDSKNYFLKGIKVCDEWLDFINFKEWALSNGYNDKLTIERKDNSKNYCPENCLWVEKSYQSKNRTSNHYITYNGETKTLSDWAKELNINRLTLSSRLSRGWSIEKAFNTKPD